MIVKGGTITRTQEQATASWIQFLYNQRLATVVKAFNEQDINLEAAIDELNKLKEFVADENHILGSILTKHGEIAEHCQVNISNARNLVNGLMPQYSFENVGRTAPEDYLKDGFFIQSKFYFSPKGTLLAIRKHLSIYPDFIKNGGSYEIPRDQYDAISKVIKSLDTKGVSSLSKADLSLLNSLQKLEKDTGIQFYKDINTTLVSYRDVQVENINETILREENNVRAQNISLKEDIRIRNAPSFGGMLKVAGASALLEGGVRFTISILKKLKQGKHINEFTLDDWKEVGIDLGKYSVKGGIRGGVVYGMTNYSVTPANIASAYVTAVFGICETIKRYRSKEINAETMLYDCEALSIDTAISAMASLTGQSLIPIPVLGAIIGNIAGELIYEVGKKICNDKELEIIKNIQKRNRTYNEELNNELEQYMKYIQTEFNRYKTYEELAFDQDLNTAFENAVKLARHVGTPEENILLTDDDLKHFLMD